AGAGVERPAALERLAPGDRVVGAHPAAGVRGFVQRGEDVRGGAWIGAVVVPLVGAVPAGRQVRGGRVRAVLHHDVGRLDGRVRGEVRADQVAVERPVVL